MVRVLGILFLLSFSQYASAHHSMAEFDRSNIHELQGVVVKVSWRNPHVELVLQVTDADGSEAFWEIEAQDINTMSRRGLHAGLVEVGDHVRVAGNTSSRRDHVISVTNILLPNGKEIRFRGNPEPMWPSEENVGFGGVDVEQLLTTVDTKAGKDEGVFRVWMRARSGGFPSDLPLTDSARAHLQNWTEADDPNIDCTVPGMPASMRLSPPHPIDLVMRKDGNIRLRVEFFDVVRIIHMNSDSDSQEQAASAQGYSVGHWEDDVLVVNTSRVNWPYFDDMAKIPQSASVKMVERFALNEDGTQMIYELTVTDTSSFNEAVQASWLMDWRPDMEMQQYDCIPPADDDSSSEEFDYPVLPAKFAEQSVTRSLVTSEAFIGADEFFISYESEDGLIFAGGNWSDRIDIAAVEVNTDGTYGGPYILPLDFQQRERWSEVPESPIRPRLLSRDQWDRFRGDLFASVIPRTGKVGVAMHFDNDDYFLYYNEVDRFEARLLPDKPQDYSVVESISFAEFIRLGLPQLEVFLEREEVIDRRVVFDTGDAGPYSLPFLYVDLDLPIAVFVRYPPSRRESAATSADAQKAQSVGHVAQSHLGGLIVRPVTSVFRLFFVVSDAAVETVRPTWLVTLESQPIPEVADSAPMDIEQWEKQLDRITGRTSSKGTINFLIDGEEYFTRLIDAITSAQESILIRTYIFDNDDVAEMIGRLLRRRAEEGVEVKILLDGLGTIVATGADDESLPEDYVPPESVRRFLEDDSKIDVRQGKNTWLVSGDHTKTTIIDNQTVFTGGMNIGREYRYVWHDMMMEARGPIVDVIRQDFRDAWAHASAFGDAALFFHNLGSDQEYAEDIGYPVRALFTEPGNPEIFEAQLAAIRSAKSRIYIQNAYFTDDAMLYELAKARRRGVDVRVIMPLVGNHGPVNRSNVLAANAMLENGIRLYLYPGMSHIKAAIFDGWACLGSANWDKLSFRTNKELNLATSYAPVVDELFDRVFEPDFEKSVEITEPFPERWSDRLVEIVADYVL